MSSPSSAGRQRIERLRCTANQYQWGKRGYGSEVARLFAAGGHGRVDRSAPYSELWVGTHPDGPARLLRGRDGEEKGEPLSKALARFEREDHNNNTIEEKHLPFIMKIMSINHSLSLQVHPNKEQAAELHRLDPRNYPDANWKPELAYALSRFEMLCGFRPAEEIVANMDAFHELRAVIGEERCAEFKALATIHSNESYKIDSDSSPLLERALLNCVETMLESQASRRDFVRVQLSSLFERLHKLSCQENGDGFPLGCLRADTVQAMRRTYEKFPNDVGCFGALLLNHVVLEPGECCYYGTGILHAYLSGECVECVGCSNNTIRAGLTPKFVDRENLLRVLRPQMTPPSIYYLQPRVYSPNFPYVTEFATAECSDFILHRIQLDPLETIKLAEAKKFIDLPALDCPSLIIFTEADEAIQCLDLLSTEEVCQDTLPKTMTTKTFNAKRGDVFFIPARRVFRLQFQLPATNLKGVTAFRTFSYESGPTFEKRTQSIEEEKKSVIGVEELKKDDLKNKLNITDKVRPMSTTTSAKKASSLLLDPMLIFDITTDMDGFL